MKTGIDISALSNKSTGTGRFIECLLEQLYQTSHEPVKFSSRDKKVFKNHPAINKIFSSKHIYREFLLKDEMMENDIDCAIFPDYFLPDNIKIPSAAVIHDLSFITHPHFYTKKFVSFYKWKLKNTLKQNPVIAAVSNNTRKNISKHLGIKEEEILLLQGYSNIGDNLHFEAAETSDSYLLYVGHIEPRKNLLFMLKNFEKWREDRNLPLKLIIAGELWIKSAETRNLIEEYKDHPFIEIKGYVNDDELHSLYKNASAFVHTSFAEGFGFPVIEAMKYRLPVLCSGETACAEISAPFSLNINPACEVSFIDGLDNLYGQISGRKRIDYHEKYSPALMKSQLEVILERLETRVKGKTFNIPGARSVEAALEKTLLYSKLHNSGVKRETLHQKLFDVKVSSEDLDNTIIKLYVENKILLNEDEIMLNYNTGNFYSNNKRYTDGRKSRLALRLISKIPFISSIAFSGGTAHYGIGRHDDIDLFIITKKFTLYLSYFIIHLISLVLKIRKEFCANFLIDESALKLTGNNDLYTAYQVVSLKAYKNESALKFFLSRNKWILNYFPNFKIENPDYKISSAYFFLAPINKLLFLFYKQLYAKKEMNGKDSVVISDNMLKLHTNDHRTKTLTSFSKVWKSYSSNIVPDIVKERPRHGNTVKAV